MNEEIILPEDVKLEYRDNVKGYVINNQYYGANKERAEFIAKYSVATHKKCEKCGNIHKIKSYCEECFKNNRNKKFFDMEIVEYTDGMLYDYDGNHYYDDLDNLCEYIFDENWNIDDLRICTCKPNYARQLDLDDFIDDLPDDDYIPSEFEKAIETFNSSVEDIILSYSPDNKRLDNNMIKTYYDNY